MVSAAHASGDNFILVMSFHFTTRVLSIVGTLGVLVAYYFVKSLDIDKLTWVVIFVILYTGIKMLRELYKDKEKVGEENINLSV